MAETFQEWRAAVTAEQTAIRLAKAQSQTFSKPKVDSTVNTKVKPSEPPTPTWLEVETVDCFHQHVPKVIPRYTPRQKQKEMAEAVAKVLMWKNMLLAEAGVGIGKSMAYLIPLLLSKKKIDYPHGPVVISTKTIALQEQLYQKDVPQALRATGLAAHVLLCKGKTNYVCNRNLDDFLSSPQGKRFDDDAVVEWARRSDSGDRAETGAPAIPDPVWERICVQQCEPKTCPYEDRCAFLNYREARRNTAGIIICNHDLLVTDLILRQKSGKGLWLPPQAVVVDEAHSLEAITRRELSGVLVSSKIPTLIERIKANGRLRPFLHKIPAKTSHIWDEFEPEINRCADFSYEGEAERFRVRPGERFLRLANAMLEQFVSLEEAIDIALGTVKEVGKGKKAARELEMLAGEITTVIDTLKGLLESENRVHWLEKSGNNIKWKLYTSPVQVESFLFPALWHPMKSLPSVLVSGTLTVNGDFDYLKNRLGIKYRTVYTFKAESPFDYKNRMMIYIPTDLPLPSHDEEKDAFFIEAISERIAKLLEITQGRALVLFTSHRRMNAVYGRLSELSLPWPLLKQGGLPTGQILQRFREEVESVLLATGSFWEGVDIAGESLSAVIMDKLPFPSPMDPLIQAMRENVQKNGLDPHQHFDIPEMLSNLRQGSGRLIRQEEDRGIVAILDGRAAAQYKKLVEAALPPGRWTSELTQVQKWFRQGHKIANTK